MGFLWDIIQQAQIGGQQSRSDDLEARVAELEERLGTTVEAFAALLRMLEEKFGEDLNGDGEIG